MNPRTPCCHHPDYRARGLVEQGNLPVHRHTAQRARCPTGGHTIAATTAPPFDRWRTAADVVPRVLTWLRHGGPPQAIVAAFGADARPVAAGVTRAGQPGQRGHQHVGHQGPVDLQPVQADALWVKRGGGAAGGGRWR